MIINIKNIYNLWISKLDWFGIFYQVNNKMKWLLPWQLAVNPSIAPGLIERPVAKMSTDAISLVSPHCARASSINHHGGVATTKWAYFRQIRSQTAKLRRENAKREGNRTANYIRIILDLENCQCSFIFDTTVSDVLKRKLCLKLGEKCSDCK